MLLFTFAVLFTSCATHQRLGCPNKITKAAHVQKDKDC